MAEIKYIDIAISGNKKKGEYIYNNDALDNAFRLWISSGKDEYLRRQGGAWLTRHIGKQMNDDRATLIKKSIQKGITSDFQPALTVLNLTVTPNYISRKWTIVLIAYSELFRVGINQTYIVSNEG